ncbi:MAG: amino acid adenylation domain-containing protein [Psychrobium sp.]|nr:amino acid adenylation domain-containing protein [Psychrobium sp.]
MTDVITEFEQQVKSRPDKTAIIFENSQLSYQQLNCLANKLAHCLIENGVVAEQVVGLFLPRSIELVVGLLAILKAGASYLPMDINAPQERLNFVIKNTSVVCVIAQAGTVEPYTPVIDHIINIDVVIADDSKYDMTNPDLNIADNTLAYVIYTSGSTGNPKGVMIERGSLNSMLSAVQQELLIQHTDSLLAVASISFDIHIGEFFLPLVQGATLVLASDEQRLSVAQLARIINEQKISYMQATPTYWQMLVNYGWAPEHNMRLFCGGEALRESLRDELLQLNVSQLLNIYGPTEATIGATSMEMTPNEKVLIGKPLANTRVYILDKRLNPVPMGVVGELYLGGQGVARGYINNPSLTEEKFITNPFDKTERLYSTGDQVRFIKDKGIEYLGRLDDQIKRRGIRIEPAEIEDALLKLEQIEQCAIVMQSVGNRLMIAYVVGSQANSRTPIDSENTLSLLRRYLPEYMLPDVVVEQQTLPVTSNGKVDRKRLAAQNVVMQKAQQAFKPQNATQARLSIHFQQLLNCNSLVLNDSFFNIGGNSLLAMHLIITINNDFDVELTIGDIFKSPGIKALADVIDSHDAVSGPAIEKANRTKLPASLEMQFMWQSGKTKHPAAYNSLVAIAIKGKLNESALENALRTIIKRHEVFRTRLYVDESGLNQQIEPYRCEQMVLTKIEINQTLDNCPAADAWIEQATLKPFALIGGELARFNLLLLDEAEYILAIDLHHIIADGWSMANFFEELSDAYNALAKNESPANQADTLQYSDYSHWQKQQFKGPYLQSLQAFWLKYLEGDITKLKLPTDRPYIDNLPSDGGGVAVPLDNDLFIRANALCKEMQVTPFMFYFAVFNLLLQQLSGQSDLIVGIPVANRKKKRLDKVMGLFANAIVLRNDLSANPLFSDFVQQIKRNTLEAFQHDGLPMLLLEQALRQANEQQHLPVFQVLFVFQNNIGKAPTLDNLSLSPMPTKTRFSKRDFSFVLSESAEGIDLFVEYNAYLFDQKTIESMCNRYIRLVAEVLDNTNIPITHYGHTANAK